MELNEMKLQALPQFIMANHTTSSKMSAYAQQAQTPEIRQYFEKAAQTAADAKTELMGFLK